MQITHQTDHIATPNYEKICEETTFNKLRTETQYFALHKVFEIHPYKSLNTCQVLWVPFTCHRVSQSLGYTFLSAQDAALGNIATHN